MFVAYRLLAEEEYPDMLDRRAVLVGIAALVAAPQAALAAKAKFEVDPKFVPQVVPFYGYPPGTIVVDPEERFLYHLESTRTAMRYGIGVGRGDLTTSGRVVVARKAEWPFWKPTPAMIRRSPKKYARYAGGMRGGPKNPLGARAMYLYKDGYDTMLRIHGTTEPWTIGQAVSNGCIRMVNDHVIELYARVPIGTPVVIL
jgi:lipoprotein-anchoring transpeptidase ErfK/SrfK